MTMKVMISIHCDRCSHYWAGDAGIKARGVRAAAKAGGWKLGKTKDFCKSCSKEIAEAVKQAALGNLP